MFTLCCKLNHNSVWNIKDQTIKEGGHTNSVHCDCPCAEVSFAQSFWHLSRWLVPFGISVTIWPQRQCRLSVIADHTTNNTLPVMITLKNMISSFSLMELFVLCVVVNFKLYIWICITPNFSLFLFPRLCVCSQNKTFAISIRSMSVHLSLFPRPW